MMNHLEECRRRLFKIMLFFFISFVICFYYNALLFHGVVSPLMRVLTPQNDFIVTQITAAVLTPMRLAWDVALLLTAPMALFQGWQFISPALYRRERNGLKGGLFASLVLFVMGLLFCFYAVLPFLFKLFLSAGPRGVHVMPDITSTVDFIVHMLLLFGVCFQLPLLCVVLVRMGVLSVSAMLQLRPYVIVLAFVVGMLLTPPDVLSQIFLAVPLCLLYEGGMLWVRLMTRKGGLV